MTPLIGSICIGPLGVLQLARTWHAFRLNREHPEAKRAAIYELTGCDTSITNGALLNHLEDWRYAYDTAIAPHKTNGES